MTLFEIVKELAACNNVGFLQEKEWPCIQNLAVLERQASKLPDELVFVFVDGEDNEAKEIAEEYDIYELDNFLNAVFIGDIKLLL